MSQAGQTHRLKALSAGEMLAYQHGKIAAAFAFTDAIKLLVMIVTVAGIFDLLLSAIFERRRELALWRLIGADDRDVRRSVVIESATIGAIGMALGAAVSLVTAWIWVAINFRYLVGYALEYHFATRSLAWSAVLVLAMTVLAGYAAASQATRRAIIVDVKAE